MDKQKELFKEWLCDHAEFAVTENDLREMYDDMLDDTYGVVSICGQDFDAFDALRRLDKTSYYCGFYDWIDGQWDEVDNNGDWYYPSDRNVDEDFSEWLGDNDDNDEPDWESIIKEKKLWEE